MYTLYSTLDCHLCEQAERILQLLSLAYIKTDICDSDALIAQYGQRIPVLRSPAGKELNWPFDQALLTAFCAEL